MRLVNKLTRRLGLRKLRYGTIHPKMVDYLAFKMLAAKQKKNHVDFFNELIRVFLECKKQNHESKIADLYRKQDALVDRLKLYYNRVGEIYPLPSDKTLKSSLNGDLR